jgi:hypothetical protein
MDSKGGMHVLTRPADEYECFENRSSGGDDGFTAKVVGNGAHMSIVRTEHGNSVTAYG